MANDTPYNYVFTVDLAAQDSKIIANADRYEEIRKIYLHD